MVRLNPLPLVPFQLPHGQLTLTEMWRLHTPASGSGRPTGLTNTRAGTTQPRQPLKHSAPGDTTNTAKKRSRTSRISSGSEDTGITSVKSPRVSSGLSQPLAGLGIITSVNLNNVPQNPPKGTTSTGGHTITSPNADVNTPGTSKSFQIQPPSSLIVRPGHSKDRGRIEGSQSASPQQHWELAVQRYIKTDKEGSEG